MAINRNALFSSNTDKWETPEQIYEQLNNEFNFTTDVCALPENTKCKHYFTPIEDGLKQQWQGTCWCNPPYNRQIGSWIRKAAKSKATTVMLIPARTDTKWFHEWILPNAEIRFIKGRLKFGQAKHNAPFPSMIVIFRNN